MGRMHFLGTFAALLIAFTWSGPSSAAFIEFDMRGSIDSYDPTLPTAAAWINFVVDTQSLTRSVIETRLFNNPHLVGNAVALFDFEGMAVQSLSVQLGSHSFFLSEGQATARIDGYLSSPGNGGDYDIYGQLLWETGSLSLTDMNSSDTWMNGIRRSDVEAADDSVSYILQEIDKPSAFTHFSSLDFGLDSTYRIYMQSLVVREVPEPSTTALLVLGLGLLIPLSRRRTR